MYLCVCLCIKDTIVFFLVRLAQSQELSMQISLWCGFLGTWKYVRQRIKYWNMCSSVARQASVGTGVCGVEGSKHPCAAHLHAAVTGEIIVSFPCKCLGQIDMNSVDG